MGLVFSVPGFALELGLIDCGLITSLETGDGVYVFTDPAFLGIGNCGGGGGGGGGGIGAVDC